MTQLQGIPSSISIDQNFKTSHNPGTNQKSNNFINLLNKAHNSQTQSSQSQNSSYSQMLNIKGMQNSHQESKKKNQDYKSDQINGNKRVLRFSQLDNANFAKLQQSQSSQDIYQQNNTIDLKIKDQLKGNKTSDHRLRKISSSQKDYICKKNKKLIELQKIKSHQKSNYKKSKQKSQKIIHNINKISVTVPSQSNKLCKKGLNQRLKNRNKQKDIGILLIQQIYKNKQLEQKLIQSQKQNFHLRDIICQFGKKHSEQDINQEKKIINPSIITRLNKCNSNSKFVKNKNRSKQSKQSKKKLTEIAQVKKQIIKLQDVLAKLNKNISGIQFKQRKMKVSSAIFKSKQRLKTQTKQKTIIQ